jgi:hypothetical protein
MNSKIQECITYTNPLCHLASKVLAEYLDFSIGIKQCNLAEVIVQLKSYLTNQPTCDFLMMA